MADFSSLPMDELPIHDHIHESDEEPLSITRNEALFLDDSFTLMIEKEVEDLRITAMRPVQMTAALAVPMELLEKVGKAVVFTGQPDNAEKEYKIVFDLSELLMIREIASSYIKIGEEPVGYNLKRKVSSILYGEEVERDERDKLADHLLKDIDIDFSETKREGKSSEQTQSKAES